jgi:hypothetical protein
VHLYNKAYVNNLIDLLANLYYFWTKPREEKVFMLDFLLVLGQVPGTDFQITFTEIVFSLGIGIVIYLKRRPVKRWLAKAKSKIKYYIIKRAQQRRQLSLPV